MPQPASQRALLELVGGARLPDLSGLDWQLIAQLAALHRLEPLLQWRHGEMSNSSRGSFELVRILSRGADGCASPRR